MVYRVSHWFRGIITCLPTISTFAVLRLSAYPYLAPSSELVHFRHRIGEEGVELILKESIRTNLAMEDRKKEEEDRNKGKMVVDARATIVWDGTSTRFQIELCFQCFVHITKCRQGNYEGDGNGIFYVFIQVTDDQHLSGETNF